MLELPSLDVDPYTIMSTDGWMDELLFYVLFNSIPIISGLWADDNEMLCALEPRLGLRRFRLERGSNPGPLEQ